VKALLFAASLARASGPLPPASGPSVEAATGAWVSGAILRGEVAPFSASERDIQALAVQGRWAPIPTVELRADWAWARARFPAVDTGFGSGDLRLGTRAVPWEGRGPIPGVVLDWEVKLPNAPEDSGLGTDETDVQGMVLACWTGDRWRLQAGGGLAILGSPVQHAAQDDAALVHARGALELGPTWVQVGLDGRLQSPRNPHDLRADVGLSWTRGRLSLGAVGLVGLTPAAPDLGARLLVGLVPADGGA